MNEINNKCITFNVSDKEKKVVEIYTNKNKFLEFVKITPLDKDKVIETIREAPKPTDSLKLNRLEKILNEYETIEGYVTSIFSEAGTINPVSENNFKKIEEQKEDDYQKDQVKNIDKILHGAEKAEFINFAKKKIMNALYTRSEYVPAKRKSFKYFITSDEDISNSLKMLQKEIYRELTGISLSTVTTQKKVLTDLYRKFNEQQKYLYLLVVNFDNFVEELSNNLINVENNSDIYAKKLKYTYKSKLDLIKNYGSSEVKIQENPGIKNYINTIATKEGIYLNTQSFNNAFHEIIKILGENNSLNKLYENMDNYSNIMATNISANEGKWDTTLKNNVWAVFDNVFNEGNENSLISIHLRTKQKYPKLSSDLYTMLCNSMNNMVSANYTAVTQDANTQNLYLNYLKEKNIDSHKTNIENHIVNSLNNESIENYLNKYIDISIVNGKLQATTKENVISEGKLKFTFDNKKVKIDFFPNNRSSKLLNVNNNEKNNNEAKNIIKNNNVFIQDTILINIKEIENAFDEISDDGGALSTLEFVGATVLTRIFNHVNKDIDDIETLKGLAKKQFGDLNYNHAFSEISNIFKPGIIALTGLKHLADVYAIVYGDANKSFVTNLENNKLPVYKNFSLGSTPNLLYDILKNENISNDYKSTFKFNFLNNKIKWTSATMDSIMTINPKTKEEIPKSIIDLNENELFYNSFIYNYLNPPTDIAFQTINYSDKSTIINQIFNRSELFDLIDEKVPENYKKAPLVEKIKQVYYNHNKGIAQSLAHNIFKDLNIILYKDSQDPQEVTYDNLLIAFEELIGNFKSSVDENGNVQTGISKLNNRISEILKTNPKFECIEEIHYSLDKKGDICINPTLLHFFEMFLTENQDKFLEKINIQKALTVYNLKKSNFSIRHKTNTGKSIFKDVEGKERKLLKNIKDETQEYILFEDINSDEFNVSNILLNRFNVKLDEKLEEFLLLDMFISDQFNLSAIGNAFIHNAKMKGDGTSNTLLAEFKNKNVNYHRIAPYENTQTISMYKRAVGYTANMFTPAKGLIMGLPDNLNFAILDDPQEIVINAQNTSGVVDSHDGAIFFSSLVNDMLSTSLGELTVNKKFFKPFVLLPHSNYCATSEIKSAGFTINNYTIRESVNSSENYGVVFKKMHNIPFAKDFVLNLNTNEFTGVSYLTDLGIENGEKYLATINSISTTNGREITVNRTISEQSNIKNSHKESIKYEINSIYDLWMMLGGAYSYKNDVFTEESLSKIYDLFEKNPDLKNYMVHFLVKPSACKTGITNRNGRESLLNSDAPFNSFSSPSHYFGMQLDASHEIEDGDITGSVQQISSLIQGGFTEEEANDVYNSIGDLISETMENLNLSNVSIDTQEKKEKLKETLSKFVINNISNRTDEAGLTNAIIRFAESQNNSIIPFDDPNVINLFTSLVNSVITKNIIKRTSAGIPAIQSPTANLLSVIEDENGNVLTNSEIYKNNLTINDKIINDSNDLSLVKPGDVIILNGEYRLVAGYNKKIKKGFKHRYDIIGLEDVRNLDLSKSEFSLAIANSKGRNLRGQTHNITLKNGKKVDLFDLDISKLSYYLEDVSLTNKKNLKFSDDKNVNDSLLKIYDEFKKSLSNNLSKTLDNVMNNYISSKTDNSSLASIHRVKYWNQLHELLNIVFQNELAEIKKGKFKLGNSYVDIESTDIKPAECVLGNAYAAKYGLKQNDFLGDVLKNDNEFFKNKLTNAYFSNNTQHDLILMSLSSPKIYVNIVEELNPDYVNTFKTITQDDGKQYVIDKNEKIIAPFDKKLIQIREEDDQIILDIKLENLNLLDEPSIFGYIKINNTSNEVLNILKDNKIISDNFMSNEYLSNGIFDIDKYNNSLSNYIERQSKKLTTSFIQGLEYVGIRIPAQSMQSFMNLKAVAFTPEETNVVYIPSEIILYQGSDFDIDKLYMMGASINNQGIYDSWSPFFNYNSVDLLKLSHKLPIPTKKKIEQDANGLNIDNLIEGIDPISLSDPLSDDKNSLIKFIELLKQVNKVNSITGSDFTTVEAFVNLINKHNLYDMTFDQKINAIKNKIYGYSLIIGNDVENYIFQTTPMSADIAKTIAQLAPNDIEHFSNNNFISRLLAQYRTQVGKGGIGINANGIKGFSGLSIYFQNKYKNVERIDDIKNLLFTIKGFDPKEKTLMNFDIPTIFNTNLNTVLDENIRKSLNTEKWKSGNIPIDGFKLLSVLITAATDNAKDPILQGINCTPALNSMYILLISLGVDVYKVGEFFTNPFMLELSKHVNSDFSKEEKFESNLKSAINYMFDGPNINDYAPTNGWKYEDGRFSFSNSIKTSDEEEIDLSEMIDPEELEEPSTIKNNKIWQNRFLAELKYYKDNIESKFEDILSKNKTENIKGRNVKSNTVKNNLLALESAAKELTSLVRLLSIDGGVKNNRQEFLEHIHNVESNIKTTLGKKSEFNLDMFLNNDGYNKRKVKEYESEKSVFNILDIINEIPHVKKMLQAMMTAKTTVNTHSVKGELGEKFLKDIKYNFFPFKKLPSDTNSKIYKYLDQIITYKFLKENITDLKINKLDSYYTNDYLKETLSAPLDTKSLNFANYADVLTYKNWFEEKFIPTLKESDLYKHNKLISNLIVTSTFNSTRTERISLLSPNVDLSLLKLEGHRNKYIEFLNGFAQIKNSKHNLLDENITIGDAFMIYNLIVNQNRPGKYSLNEIFDSYFYNDNDNSSIFKKFLEFENNLKNTTIEDKKDYDLTDLKIRFLQKDKEQNSLKREWDKKQNRFIIKENNKLIKYVPNDDSLELSHFVKNIKYFKDDKYSEVYKLLVDAIKSNKAIIEFRCD